MTDLDEAVEVEEVESAADDAFVGAPQAGEASSANVGRCEAETTVGGTLYRCALQEEHEGDHSFSPELEAELADAPPVRDNRKIADALDNEAVRHAVRLAEILGVPVEPASKAAKGPERYAAVMAALAGEGIVSCPLCPDNFSGWRADAAPDDETTQRVRVAIGLPDVSNFAMSATERPCDDCRGLGKVRTGSLVPGRETSVCDACAGAGYVASRPRLNAAPPVTAEPVVANGAPAYPDDGIRRDMFGTPEGDPDFEKLPGARQRPVDYWQKSAP